MDFVLRSDPDSFAKTANPGFSAGGLGRNHVAAVSPSLSAGAGNDCTDICADGLFAQKEQGSGTADPAVYSDRIDDCVAGVRFCFPEQMGDLAMYEYGNGMPAVLCSMCGAWLSIWVGIRINAAENVVVEKIGQIGRYTMWILCAHSFEATVVPWNVLTVIAPEQTWTYCILKLVLRSIFVFMVCILLSKLGGNKHAGKNH